MKKKFDKLIVVLGMHRSGTSVITRGLQVMGVELGDKLMPPVNGNNNKGFWEDLDINSLNIEMLNSLSKDWHFLTPIQASDVEALRRDGYVLRALELLKEKTSGNQTFGFKDPRVTKLLPFWREVFLQSGMKVNYIISLRHPLSVCQSLVKRDGFDIEKGALLWLEHVLSSFVGTAGETRIVVDYDRVMQLPEAEIKRIAKSLQLQIDPSELKKFKTEFLDDKLRHTIYETSDLISEDAIPPLAREVYAEALKVAINNNRLHTSSFKTKITKWDDEFSRQKSSLVLADKLSLMNKALIEREQASVAEKERLLAEKERLLAEKERLLRTLNTLQSSLIVQLLNKYRVLIERFLPNGTPQRHIYNLLIKKLRVLIEYIFGLLKGIRALWANIKSANLQFPKQAIIKLKSGKSLVSSTLSLDHQAWDKSTPILALLSKTSSPLEELPTNIRNHAENCLKKNPLNISVIMATWNREKTMSAAIESALNQSYPPYEIIISDDGSTDDTINLIRTSYVSEIASGKLRILVNPHSGVSAARNKALEVAQGDIVTYLDSDNTWRGDYLLLVAATFTENDEIYTSYAGLKHHDRQNSSERVNFKPYSRRDLLTQNYIDLNVFAHRRALVEQQGMFDESLSRLVDWDLIIRYTHNYPPALISYIGTDYYLDPNVLNNITYSTPLEENRTRVYQKHNAERLRLGIIPLRLAYILWDFPSLSQTFVMNELRWLVENGYDVKVYYSVSPDKEVQLDFPIESYKVRDSDHVARLLIEHQRNYCHSHFVYPAVTLLTYPACVKTRIPFTFMPHAVDIFHYENRKRNKIGEIASHDLCRKVFVYGDHHKDFLQKQGIQPEKIAFTFQAVDLQRLKHLGNKKPRTDTGRRTLRGIAIARFIEKKGIAYLIEAAKLLQDDPVVFEIYGYGPLQEAYKRQIDLLGLTNISLMGLLKSDDELFEAYRNADFMIVPSAVAENGDMDGFPTVILEAMASELPVVTTSVSAVPDYLADKVEAFLVPPADPKSLANAIRELIRMPVEKRNAIVQRAGSLLNQKIGVDKTMSTLLDIWFNQQIDIFLVSYNTERYEARKETYEIVRRILERTTTPYTLTIIDNASSDDFWKELSKILEGHSNTRLIRKKKNILLGPASNVALRMSNTEFAIYICSKEGFIKAHGWERDLIDFMRDHPDVALAGHLSYQPKYVYGHEIPDHPGFRYFRNPEFALKHPSKSFAHVQGGLFILDRKIYVQENGFNPAIPQANMDVEMSYYLESKGYKLGKIPTLASITTKTRPTLTAIIDENTVAAHPLSISNVSPILDSVGKDKQYRCNLCAWKGKSFQTLNENDEVILKCPSCGSTNFGRLIFRFLANDYRAHRNLNSALLSIDKSLLKAMIPMFNLNIKENRTPQFIEGLKKVKNKMHCIVFDPNLVAESDNQKLWETALNCLGEDGEILFADKYWEDSDFLMNARASKNRIIAEAVENIGGNFSLEYSDYKSIWLGFGWQRLGRIKKVNNKA